MMVTTEDVATLDFIVEGEPFTEMEGATGLAVTTLDFALEGEPFLGSGFGSGEYTPEMYANPSVNVTLTGDLTVEKPLEAVLSCQCAMTGFINLGNTAKMVSIF